MDILSNAKNRASPIQREPVSGVSPEESIIFDCSSCLGMGYIDIGDCEDGVTDTCPECDGKGIVKYE